MFVCFFMFRWLGNDFPIKISFEICSKQLLTMRNRFLTLPKAEKLNFNEFLRFKVLKSYQKSSFSQKCRKSILQHAILCKKNAAKTAILSVLRQTFQNDMFLPKYIFAFFHFFIFFVFWGRRHDALAFK